MRGWVSTGIKKRMVRDAVAPAMVILMASAGAWASGGGEGGHGLNWADFGWRMLNFSVLVGFLYWLLAAKIKEFFVGRRANIKASLDAAVAAKEEAEKKYQEYSAKIEKATDEISGIAEAIKAQGLAEKEKIVEDAKKTAAKIKEDAKARMEQDFAEASNQLRLEAARLSVRMAEDILKRNVTAADHEIMVRDYLDKVVTKH